MKTPRIPAVLVQLPGVDEVATAGVCEWAARADFKAVCQEFELKKRRGRFLLFREEKIVSEKRKFAQLLTLEVKVESEIGEVEGNAFVDNVDFGRHGVASELRISYLQELSKIKSDRKLAQDKSIFYWAFLSTTKRNRRFGDKAKEKLRDCRKR